MGGLAFLDLNCCYTDLTSPAVVRTMVLDYNSQIETVAGFSTWEMRIPIPQSEKLRGERINTLPHEHPTPQSTLDWDDNWLHKQDEKYTHHQKRSTSMDPPINLTHLCT
jgi:hypothetical protein